MIADNRQHIAIIEDRMNMPNKIKSPAAKD
jgi:hypothetical protein